MKTKNGSLRENYAFIIAIIVVVSFVFFFGYVLLVLQNMPMLEKLTALYGGIMAAILGYFFGQRPVMEITKQVQNLEKEKETLREDYEKTKEDKSKYEERLKKLTEKYMRDMNRIEKEMDGD